ncbi:MAG: hypothetical protein ACOC1K_02980 [Nanoarchaeota archaeon]
MMLKDICKKYTNDYDLGEFFHKNRDNVNYPYLKMIKETPNYRELGTKIRKLNV